MGPSEGDPVTPELLVRGVAGLRVADASVMPRIVGGNTHAPTVMVGEKAAELILAKWGSGTNGQKETPGKTDKKAKVEL